MRTTYFSIFFISSLLWQTNLLADKSFSKQEVSLHKNADDCWIVIGKDVYDISKFIKDHEDKCKEMKLTDFCGADASKIWQEKESIHKRKSILQFERSRIGKLNTSEHTPR